ncbi:MAG: dihydroorotate dehydrogenase-like protein [Phycisphaeraceae bacterium]
MDLETNYLGFKLPHPLTVGASPLSDSIDSIRRLVDAGAAMITLRSLFAEQIAIENGQATIATHHMRSDGVDFVMRPHEYLEHLRRVRQSVPESVPILASLNVARLDQWIDYVRLIDECKASALELNIYSLSSDVTRPAEAVESDLISLVQAVRRETAMPLAVKLLPFYTSLANLGLRLSQAGANALVLFNRLYQPDIEPAEQREDSSINLGERTELLPRLRWLGLLYGRIPLDLAISGGVHSAQDVLKAVMCGAQAAQLVSALLDQGVSRLQVIRDDLSRWLEQHGHGSLASVCGSMSLCSFPSPELLERSFYVRMLQGWNG